ncbi:MAG: DUF4139 domain-containing protein, partial [Odoribacter sp.]|nr:DUF4139 domain-containing protein [Odoribacter sp.]
VATGTKLNQETMEKKTVESTLKQATIFFKGAELIHTSSVTLAKGQNEIAIKGLSPDIDVSSLKIKTSNGVVVTSHEYVKDYLTSPEINNVTIQKLQESLEKNMEEIRKVDIGMNIINSTLEYLRQGTSKNVSGSEKGLGVEELVKTVGFFVTQSEEMEMKRMNLEKRRKDLNETHHKINSQLQQETVKSRQVNGVLNLNLSAPLDGNSTITITYYTAAAYWLPYYDVNIASVDKPIQIKMKSKVTQTTGLDWEKVKVILSTAVPTSGKEAPLFSAWFLRQQGPVEDRLMGRASGTRAIQNAYSYEVIEESADMELSVVEDRQKQVIEPIIVIDGQEVSKSVYENLDSRMIKDINVLNNEDATNIYGARAAAGAIVVTLKQGMEDFVTETENVLDYTYDVEIPQTIPGNGKVQHIDLQVKETSAEFKYYAAPKLDGEVYLLAEISNWEKLGLMSGQANITFDGTYLGETYINASSIHSKLTLTLGTDQRISVKREKQQDYSSSKMFGNDAQQTFAYKLTVKNNQNKAVKLILKDQYPISTQKGIEVNLLRKETTAWTANVEELGVITWEEELAPGETKTYQISYTVKYPKDMKLNL